MTLPTNTTQLQAVNTILSVFGSAPVNSVVPPYTSDVAMALNILEESLKEVQSEGWYFQREYNVQYTADVNGEIAVPADLMSLDHPYRNVVVRDGKVYDLERQTFNVGDLKLDVVRWVDFDLMPESARRYVVAKASRKFFERRTDHSERVTALYREETLAKTQLMYEESETSDATIFDSRVAYQIVMRPSVLAGMGPR